MMDLTAYLADLEERISPDAEDAIERDWLTFTYGDWPKSVFAPSRTPVTPGVDWPRVYINDAFSDMQLMLYMQLKYCSETLSLGKGELLSVRPNYGTGIIPSMFGAETFFMPLKHDMLPAARSVGKILCESADYSRGLAPSVFEFGERFMALSRDYPRINRYVHIYNPDLQGPFPLCEAVLGADVYTMFYEDERAIIDALALFTAVYIDFTQKWQALCPPFSRTHSVEWGLLHRGLTIIRNDAATNISGDMYARFVMPHDAEILHKFGGGVHFCGKGDHYIDRVCAIPNIAAINLSQPELNDMEKIYSATVDRNIKVIGLPEPEVLRALNANRPLPKGRVHCGAAIPAWVK